jgi:hypothetical protein
MTEHLDRVLHWLRLTKTDLIKVLLSGLKKATECRDALCPTNHSVLVDAKVFLCLAEASQNQVTGSRAFSLHFQGKNTIGLCSKGWPEVANISLKRNLPLQVT